MGFQDATLLPACPPSSQGAPVARSAVAPHAPHPQRSVSGQSLCLSWAQRSGRAQQDSPADKPVLCCRFLIALLKTLQSAGEVK